MTDTIIFDVDECQECEGTNDVRMLTSRQGHVL